MDLPYAVQEGSMQKLSRAVLQIAAGDPAITEEY